MFGWILGKRAEAEIGVDELQRSLEGPDRPFLLDVREPSEYAVAHVPGAVLIPLGQLEAHVEAVPADREVAVICRSGARSGRATQLLRARGRHARNVAGGMLAWRGPIARGT